MDEREFSEEEAHAILRRAISLKASRSLAPTVAQQELFDVAAEAGIEREFVAAALARPSQVVWSWDAPYRLTIQGIDAVRYQHKLLGGLETGEFSICRQKHNSGGFTLALESGMHVISLRFLRHEDEVVVSVQANNFATSFAAGFIGIGVFLALKFFGEDWFPSMGAIFAVSCTIAVLLFVFGQSSLQVALSRIKHVAEEAIAATGSSNRSEAG